MIFGVIYCIDYDLYIMLWAALNKITYIIALLVLSPVVSNLKTP